MEIFRLEKTDSTNTWVTQHESELGSPCLVYCKEQTAGRGQRGNSWESEPGKNITASLLFHPKDLQASEQFKISEAVALALVDYLHSKGVDALIKWPNDIYVGDKKICGILVEHAVTGRFLMRTIAGFGLNINQTEFRSDAPNPVSLSQLTGKEYDIQKEVKVLSKYLGTRIDRLRDKNLHVEFEGKLWRNDGKHHLYHDRLRNELITAKIDKVAQDGILSLITAEGERRDFAFKEIEFIRE